MSIRSADFTRNIRYVCASSPGLSSFRLAMELLQQNRFDPLPLITHRIPFEQFPKAYDIAYYYEDDVVKILLTFD